MSFSAVLRRASAAASTLAVRSLSHRPISHSTALLRPLLAGNAAFCRWIPGVFGSKPFSSVASDAGLVRVIDAEIECAEESEDHDQVSEVPDKFPFEIKDEQGTGTVVLTRNFHGEDIEVVVSMPSLVSGDDGNDQDGNDDEPDDQGPTQSSIPLIVKVSKGNGPGLEFCCTAFADEVTIDSLTVREAEVSDEDLAYEGPEFSDLDENLQKAFHKYLEIRGISPATTNFLHEYMINKDSREYLLWMKNLKKFIEK